MKFRDHRQFDKRSPLWQRLGPLGGLYIVFDVYSPMSNHGIMEKEALPGSSYSDRTPVDLFSDETVDPVYQAKAHVLNQAIQEIGMGKYQVNCRINYAFFDSF